MVMEKQSKNVSMSVVKRLPKYYRTLKELEQKGTKKISSQKLAQIMGITASQIRQDLNSFGAYGQQGYGYNVTDLKNVIIEILGLDLQYHCILIGAGNMGQALANYERYNKDGIKIEALFDKNPEKVQNPGDSEVLHIDELENYVKNHDIDIAILAIPKEVGQEIAERVINTGIKAILNFVPIDLDLPEDIKISNVNINDSLYQLTYLLSE